MKLRHALLPLSLLAALPSVAAARGLEVRDMVAMDRVSAPVLTADGGTVVFAKRSVDANLKASTALFARNLRTRDAAPPKQITPAGWNVNSASLSADGQTVYFLSARNGSQQLYAQPISGGTPRQLTDFPSTWTATVCRRRTTACCSAPACSRRAPRTWPAPRRS